MNRREFIGLTAAAAGGWASRPLAAAPSVDERGRLDWVPLRKRTSLGGPTLFRTLDPAITGIRTENRYADASIWSSRYAEFKVGSIGTGVAIGDYDNDGRPDLFVVSKTESCRLFRNLGDWKFEDVTEQAGVGDVGDAARIWKQGATFVDFDNNGRLDIYVCRFNAPNLLYVNQGDGTFKEEAAARGLAINDGCVMAAFCDYDRDGFLDVFIQTNAPEWIGHPRAQRNYLLHNNGDGTFTDVTTRSGIGGRGQGHSAIWWDFDQDGWPDLYVGYDFTPRDRLYRNNRDGTFTEVIDSVVPHLPFSTMGIDLGDVNNDGRIDLLVSDMAATARAADLDGVGNARALLADPPDGSAEAPQCMRNALFLNTGTGRCLEGAVLAGLAATDWTWAVRLEDFDNDGRLDVFVTNGMYRDLDDFDLMARIARAEGAAEKVAIERESPEMPQRHLALRNLGDLRFEDASARWGLDARGISFGAAVGDFDGTGNLAIVYANYHGGVTVLRNEETQGHRVVVHLRGSRSNRYGVGAIVRLETAGGVQVRPLVLARGLMSSSEPMLHFGLGAETRIQRLTVEWPSGCTQSFSDLPVDVRFTVREAHGDPALHPKPILSGQFTEVGGQIGFSLLSRELPVDELAEQPLLPTRFNRRGPALAIADVAGDGREEVAVGGTVPDPLRRLRLHGATHFNAVDATALQADASVNDGPLLFFDAFGSGRCDLLVTKGGVGSPAGSSDYQPIIYVNDGAGGFGAAAKDVLPPLPISAGAVAAADFDRDGRLDLFIGGRVVPGQYPVAPRSALLANRHGRFEDVTDQLAPGLREVGLVSGAIWSDVDGDGWPDLLLALEWGQVKYFHNRQGQGFEDWTDRAGFGAAGAGWWTSIASADFNGDGRPDFVVGNVGLNTPYAASAENPLALLLGDFNGDGNPQVIEASRDGGRWFPRRTRRELGAAVPSVLRKFDRDEAYARAPLDDILGFDSVAAARRWSATELRSGVFLSQPDGTYRFEPLPRLAQIAPIQGLVAGDFDGDGHADIACVQNSFAPIPSVGRFDGGLGGLLRGDGRGGFEFVAAAESGMTVAGDAKALAVVDFDLDGWPDLLATRNSGATLAFRNAGRPGRHSIRVRLQGRAGNPAAIGARVRMEYSDGSSLAAEVTAGGGYWSQSTADCFFGWTERKTPQAVHVRWPDGAESRHGWTAGATAITLAAVSR
ncbi:MAG TPA: FG-GAP-like repeat-containing protein [Opitutaceae bacterium]